jgi:hypothetical protein
MKLSYLALSLSMALSSVTGFAQNAPAQRPAMQRTPPTAAQTSGTVTRMIVGPGGHVRGLVLNNGTVVMTHGRGGDDIAQRVRVGQAVRVEGFSHPGTTTTIFRPTIRATDGTVIAQPPALPEGAQGWGHGGRFGARGHGPGMGRGGHHGMMGERFAALQPQTANGAVQQVINGPRGSARTLLLPNNVSVFLPGHMHPQLMQRTVRVGETVRVTGRGSATPNGTGIFADSITFSDGTTITAPVSPAPTPPQAR